MTTQEYEQKKRECWSQFCAKHQNYSKSPLARESFNFAFDRAYALGKQEKDADTVIQGWVSRDMDGAVYIHKTKPYRGLGNHGKPEFWVAEVIVELPATSFPDLTWESDPEPVEIIIKRKKK